MSELKRWAKAFVALVLPSNVYEAVCGKGDGGAHDALLSKIERRQ